MNVYEMEGFLRGKCMPRDILVNESTAAYLVRKLNEVTAFKADRDALAVENGQLKEINSRLCAELQEYESDNDDFGPAPQSVVNCFALLTPNTDAALAAIRADALAEGAEACVRALVTSDDDDFTDAPNICAMVAFQLREAK
ncbi:hypothetical protein [Serratia quinivorans]|uniref:hypothetical protein n=1 Tax=Serratia quinivorans TaxID=137545 RepID=UPI003F980C81